MAARSQVNLTGHVHLPFRKLAVFAASGRLGQLETLTQARARPHVLDDATIDRVDRVYGEQLEFVDIYTQQIRRWRNESPSVDHIGELDRMEKQNQELRAITAEVLALARELRKGTIDRIMDMSDLELGLQAVLGKSL